MTVPTVFRNTRPRSLTNYSWIDIANATGIQTYYGVNTFDGSGILSPTAIDSYSWRTSGTPAASESKKEDKDYDLLFNVPQTVKGTLTVTHTYAVTNNNGVNTVHGYTKVRVYHYDGSTETEIGTQVTTTTLSSGGVGQVEAARSVIKFASLNQHFKKGETLRVNIEMWSWLTSGSSSYQLYTDGSNRGTGPAVTVPTAISGDTANTNIIVQVPYKIDV